MCPFNLHGSDCFRCFGLTQVLFGYCFPFIQDAGRCHCWSGWTPSSSWLAKRRFCPEAFHRHSQKFSRKYPKIMFFLMMFFKATSKTHKEVLLFHPHVKVVELARSLSCGMWLCQKMVFNLRILGKTSTDQQTRRQPDLWRPATGSQGTLGSNWSLRNGKQSTPQEACIFTRLGCFIVVRDSWQMQNENERTG